MSNSDLIRVYFGSAPKEHALSDPPSVTQEGPRFFNRRSQELFMRNRLEVAGLFRFAQSWLGCSWYGERDSDAAHQRTGRSENSINPDIQFWRKAP
jgi:hypothetical protein